MRLSKSISLAGLVLGAGASFVLAQTVAQDSPFKSIPMAGSPSGSNEKFELSGISVVGPKTFICLYDSEKKQNRWLAVGESGSGVEVVSCDVKANQATLKIGGQLKTLTLRKSAISPLVAASGTAEVTGPLAVVTPPPAEATSESMTPQQVQEREARMLVSDLLEIGMQQRKAYEQKKATEDAAKQQGTPVPTPTSR